MNMFILNRDSFQMPDDGWYQLAPLGEFPHAAAGIVQVVDVEACTAMAARFNEEAGREPFDKLRAERFAGLLVDFDHFSLDERARSEAAGWIVGVEARGEKSDASDASDVSDVSDGAPGGRALPNQGAGLWAKIRWSDVGEAAVKGGRYRFLSPVWARSDCVDLGPSTASASSGQAGSGQGMQRVRPVRLLNAAVTNDPNLKGLMALSNRSQESEFRSQNGEPVDWRGSIGAPAAEPSAHRGARACERSKEIEPMKRVIEKLTNHMGLPGDATEDVILEKMQGLPGLTAVADLQNSLKQAQEERDALQQELKGVEDEIVNRHLAEFDGVISEGSKGFWAEQLLENREAALTALADIASLRAGGKTASAKGQEAGADAGTQTRRPLHNRATARPVIPGQGGGATGSDTRAAKIRNRAHEICKAEKVPFSTAFRRAEKEILEG